MTRCCSGRGCTWGCVWDDEGAARLFFEWTEDSSAETGIHTDWGNKTGSARWTRVFTPRLFGNFWLTGSRFTDLTPKEVGEDIQDYNFDYGWIQNTPAEPGQSTIQTFWFILWFYSRYEIVVYAVDENYQHFLQTYDEVQEADGNFHEPEFAIEGDGIGVFGAMVPDTMYVEVVRQ